MAQYPGLVMAQGGAQLPPGFVMPGMAMRMPQPGQQAAGAQQGQGQHAQQQQQQPGMQAMAQFGAQPQSMQQAMLMMMQHNFLNSQAQQRQQQQQQPAQQQQQGASRPASAGGVQAAAPMRVATPPAVGAQGVGAHATQQHAQQYQPQQQGQAGGQQQKQQQPPTNFVLSLRYPGEHLPRQQLIPADFLRDFPAEWPSWVANPAMHAQVIISKFSQWTGAGGVEGGGRSPLSRYGDSRSGQGLSTLGLEPGWQGLGWCGVTDRVSGPAGCAQVASLLPGHAGTDP